MKVLTAFVLVFMASLGFGQSESRMTTIYRTAYERLERQNGAWFKAGDYPVVVESLRYMNQIWPEDYETATNLGWMLGNIERYHEELATYVTYREVNPKDVDRGLPEAEFYFRQRAFAKVPPILEPAVGTKAHPNVYRILAHSYERLNLLADSKRVWDAYLSLNPNDAPAKVNRGRVMKKISGEIKPKKAT